VLHVDVPRHHDRLALSSASSSARVSASPLDEIGEPVHQTLPVHRFMRDQSESSKARRAAATDEVDIRRGALGDRPMMRSLRGRHLEGLAASKLRATHRR